MHIILLYCEGSHSHLPDVTNVASLLNFVQIANVLYGHKILLQALCCLTTGRGTCDVHCE